MHPTASGHADKSDERQPCRSVAGEEAGGRGGCGGGGGGGALGGAENSRQPQRYSLKNIRY